MRPLTAHSHRLDMEVNPAVRSMQQWSDPADTLVAQIKASPFVAVLDHLETADV